MTTSQYLRARPDLAARLVRALQTSRELWDRMNYNGWCADAKGARGMSFDDFAIERVILPAVEDWLRTWDA